MMTKVELACGCAPWGMCKAALSMSDRLAFEEAGVRVLSKETLLKSGIEFARSERRLAVQISKVKELRTQLQAHATL